MKKCGFTTVNERPHRAISASERACRRLLRFGASSAAPTADSRTTRFTPPSRAAQSAFDAWIGATRPGRREQPRDIDALERHLDGAEERQIAGTQLDALR